MRESMTSSEDINKEDSKKETKLEEDVAGSDRVLEEEDDSHKELTISEQMEKTSINIFTFSALKEETGAPHNFPVILGGEAIIRDEVSKLKVEEALGQLNIQSLFGLETHTLLSATYTTFRTDNDLDKLNPHIYFLKSHSNNIFLLNFLVTPYADLNIDAYFMETNFMSNALSGVYRRTEKQLKQELIEDKEQIEICSSTVNNLVGFLHYQIFIERKLRDMVDHDFKNTVLIMGLFVDYKLEHSEYQCTGQCGLTFEKDQFDKSEDINNCPSCGEKLFDAPPLLKFESIRYLFPEASVKIYSEGSKEELNPIRYLNFISSIIIPRNISIAMNRLSPEQFSHLAAVPSTAVFTSKNKDTIVQLRNHHFINGDTVTLYSGISDSRYTDVKYEEVFIPAIMGINLNRDILEGFRKKIPINKIIDNSVISHWKLTDKIKYDEITRYTSINDIPSFIPNNE